MYIPGWNRSFFGFGGIRAYYYDNLFWDHIRSAWDDKYFRDSTAQNLSQYELAAKLGLVLILPSAWARSWERG